MNRSESIIISKRPLREADLLISFYSRKDGKLKGVAKNAKKSRKRFGGVLETGYVADLSYSVSSRSDLVRIDEASLIIPKAYRQTDLASTTALWLALELTDRFLPEADENREKFELLKRFVATIFEGRLTRSILIFFLIRWIGLSGYHPDLTGCVRCGMVCSESDLFSADLGGIVCSGCGLSTDLCYHFRKGSVDLLRRVMSGDVKCDIDDNAFEDILRFVFYYSMILLGKPLKLEAHLQMLMEVP